MSIFNFVSYFEDIATKHKLIGHTSTDKHFTRVASIISLDEFLNSMSNAQGYQLIVEDLDSGRFIDKHSDNILADRYFSFYILKMAEYNNFSERETILQETFSLILDIISKLFKDKDDQSNGLQYLDRNNTTFTAAGPFAHNWYGYSCAFTLMNYLDIDYVANNWNE